MMQAIIQRSQQFSLIMASTLLLAGCSLLSPVKPDEPNKYMLNEAPSVLAHRHAGGSTLYVLAPETNEAYNTTQMAYTTKPFEIAYFAKNQWAETPPQMLQPLIVQTLQNTHHFHAIVTPPYMGHYEYMLSTQILELKQNYTVRPARLEMTVRAQLNRTRNNLSNTVVATKILNVEERMQSANPYAGVLAANHATTEILRQLAAFCLEHTEH